MELVFQTVAWEQYQYWLEADKKILLRINDLIKDTLRSPFKGIGKPEPLKGNYSGCWSRRINDEHRLVYAVRDQRLHILQCRFHYDK
ncbi:Txe/YoeB family addiction module toxin [Ferruginibacter sp. HRS2-29]|uniref:Txe/YoeB family addiction module toxin n=1 Tax=Ferruginibacter sp. HRS2-29 TaxID=2487334 RepID=UPI0020CF6EEA|nr:Txe/YoeB family addiction module toxin [Ferruginibacter sp. HRS2-29]MCP9750813.1 Txe/YoeB family addiction module toxin [Ferruginibacter sp. HRS2-29]